MKIQRELLDKYLVRDIEGKDESIYIFPHIIEIDMDVKEEDTEGNTNEANNDTNNGEQVIASNTNSA